VAWTSPKTWTAAVVSVADLNTHIRDNELYLFSREGGGMYGSTTSIPYGTWTTIAWDNTWFSNIVTLNAGAGTITAPAGVYVAAANLYPPNTEEWGVRILAGGTVIAQDGSTGGDGASASTVAPVNASTAFSAQAIIKTGGTGASLISFSALPNFSLMRVG
jgi:hypothetical protein